MCTHDDTYYLPHMQRWYCLDCEEFLEEVHMIGIHDKHGTPIEAGHTVEVTVPAIQGRFTIIKGTIEYKEHDISSWGCGWGIQSDSGFTFLSSISRSHTEIEVLDDGQMELVI